ncbi:Jlp1p [Sugiyamaella lignohabitans]|uniref:Jlp1p n=1 Tax=Sugiyamaella lignohabitans TaxID=796027 RepID=A0A167EY61_9ASCO|nr:Jlp1p [Sugiyamaella lignohabitans]ANB14599.1 Jlp1p [Sugiyamaella lignohabitans]
MSPPTAVEPPKPVILDSKQFKKAGGDYKGLSPFFDKPTEGPSYQPNTKPLKASGALDEKYSFSEVSPVIGREYTGAQLRDILQDQELLRDLAITVSRRGVVFFRNQALTAEEQKELADKLGVLTGKPSTSKLHIHPRTPGGGFLKPDGSEIDPEITIISSKLQKSLYENRNRYKENASRGWHADFAFEPIPSTYSVLKIIEKPEVGGDTLWISGNGLYDKLSPSFREYLETLYATFQGSGIEKAAQGKFDLFAGPRGAPENVGTELKAVHPAIRTNPVTGWKSLYAAGAQFSHFNDITEDESGALQRYLKSVLIGSHDLQARFKWGKNDVAIWDNRSVFHSATNDYFETAVERLGVRTVGLGERPYFDPKSKSRSDDLRESGLSV